MKRIEKKFVKIDFKNAMFEVVDGRFMVLEFDKDGAVVEETDFLDAIDDLIGQPGITISIKKENDVE
jgi:histidinol phosphatase-like enzyme